jgi:hypothetical protein
VKEKGVNMANPFWEEGREPSWQKVSNYNRGQEKTLSNVNKQQNQLAQGGYKDAMGLLSDYLNPQSDVYKNFEKPYLQQFEQQTIPQIAERFGGANAMGSGLMTSGFGQSLGAAGANLQTQLAQMKEQYRRQSINDLLNQYNQITNTSLNARPFENAYDPGQEGQLSFAGKILDTGLNAAANAFGGPAGGAAYSGLSNFVQGMNKGSGGQSNAFDVGGGGGGGYQGSFGQLPNYLT